AEQQAALDLLLDQIGIDDAPAIDGGDEPLDLYLAPGEPRLRHYRNIGATKHVAGDPLPAARLATLPSAQLRGHLKAAREAGFVAEHRHAEGERVLLRDMGEFIEETLGKERRVAMRARAPIAGGHADLRR